MVEHECLASGLAGGLLARLGVLQRIHHRFGPWLSLGLHHVLLLLLLLLLDQLLPLLEVIKALFDLLILPLDIIDQLLL